MSSGMGKNGLTLYNVPNDDKIIPKEQPYDAGRQSGSA